MFTKVFEHTWESVKEHLERLFNISDDTQAEVISLRAELASVSKRLDNLESLAVFGERIPQPERNTQRIEPQPMIIRNPSALGADALGEIEVHVPVPEGDSNLEVSGFSDRTRV